MGFSIASFTFVANEFTLKEIKSISFIGSGNVATQLAKAFHTMGIRIDCVLSRTLKNAQILAKKVDSIGVNTFNQLPQDSDLYIISLKDDAIIPYLNDLNLSKKRVVHTSGSFETNKLGFVSNKIGCFYPLQTLKKDSLVDFKNIPIIIECEEVELSNLLENLAKKISNNIHILNAQQKKALHISAIGINNFTYFILSKSKEYCISNNLDFNLLKPLLKETVELFSSEEELFVKQTGPAKRGDINTIKDHIEYLSEEEEFQSLYRGVSQHILSKFHGEKFKL